jgi:hypothetical protein
MESKLHTAGRSFVIWPTNTVTNQNTVNPKYPNLDLAGKDECERVKLDQILELYRDFADQVWPYIGAVTKFQPGDEVVILIIY